MSVQLRIPAIFLLLMMAVIPAVAAWDDCPRGLVNDPYPGECSRYTDTNNDGTCDRSQPEPVAMATPVPASPEPALTTAATTTALVPLTTQKAPVAPFPAILVTVCAGLYLFRKRK
jgi:hypothetical protein